MACSLVASVQAAPVPIGGISGAKHCTVTWQNGRQMLNPTGFAWTQHKGQQPKRNHVCAFRGLILSSLDAGSPSGAKHCTVTWRMAGSCWALLAFPAHEHMLSLLATTEAGAKQGRVPGAMHCTVIWRMAGSCQAVLAFPAYAAAHRKDSHNRHRALMIARKAAMCQCQA